MWEKIKNFFKDLISNQKKRVFGELVACLLLIAIATFFGSMIQTAGFKAKVEELRGATNRGSITLTPVDDGPEAVEKSYTVSGRVESGLLFVPKNATKDTPAPAIVFTHGLYNNREMQLQNAIEMVRRGYVVMVIDHKGHGHNTAEGSSFASDTFLQASKYMYNLPYVDKAKIGVSGHSMGGSATTAALRDDGVIAGTQTDANFAAGKNMGIISAGLVQANNAPSAIGTNVIAAGVVKANADEFFFSSTLKEAQYVPVNKSSVTEDNYTQYFLKKGGEYVQQTEADRYRKHAQYYRFSTTGGPTYYLQSRQAVVFTGRDAAALDEWVTVNGGIYAGGQLVSEPNGNKLVSVARKGQPIASATTSIRAIYEANETHPMNHMSTKTASHVIDFFYNAFGLAPGVKYKAPTNQTWWMKEALAILGFIGLFGMILPLIDLFLGTELFKSLKGEPEEAPLMLKKPRKHVSYWIGGIATCHFGAYALIKNSEWMSKTKISSLFSASKGYIYANIGSIAFWGMVCALFAVAVTAIIWLINRAINVFYYKDDADKYDEKPFSAFKIRSFGNVLKTLLLAVFILCAFYGLIFLIWEQTFVDLRFWTFDLRVFDTIRIATYLKYVPFFFLFYMVSAAFSKNYRLKDLPEWATIAINCAFNVLGLIILMGGANAYFIKNGAQVPGNGLFFIACYPVIPCVLVSTIMARRIYVRTGNAWLAGILNAVIMTFLACANTSISGTVQWVYA